MTKEINGEVRTALQYAALDGEDFDPQEFARHWPSRLEDQQLALAMVVVANGRGLKALQQQHRQDLAALQASVTRLWFFAPFLLGGVVIALAHSLGVEDPVPLLASGLVGGAVGEVMKRLLGSMG
jgi:hypothetical protein